MSDLLTQLKQRKLVQWAIGYSAIAFAFLQGAQLLSETYAWSPTIMRALPIVLATGLFIVMILAWYHGERGHQRAGRAEIALIVGVSIAGILGSWTAARSAVPNAKRGSPESIATDDIRLVVLPFENLGDSASGMMASGISDQIRGKLSRIPTITVLARETSIAYRGTKLPLQDLGDTLDVQYFLTGTVRSTPASGGRPARIQVSPELVRVSGARNKPVTRWGEDYQEDLTDVFDVQNRIAKRVAEEMNVALGAKESAVLNERPTKSLAAWEEFNARRVIRLPGESQRDLFHRAASHAERATELDSTFAEAWSALASTSGLAQFYTQRMDQTGADAQRARRAADRAMKLDSVYWGPKARAEYLQWVAEDYAGAAAIYNRLLKASPNDAAVLTQLCITNQFIGDWIEAASACERAVSADPKDSEALGRGATSFAIIGDRKRALELVVLHRKVLLADSTAPDAPEDLEIAVREVLGDYAGVRVVLDRALSDKRSGARTLMNAFPHRWQTFGPAHLRRSLEVVDENALNQASSNLLIKAIALFTLGDTVGARKEAALRVRGLQERLRTNVGSRQEAIFRMNMAEALAIQGRYADAITMGERVRELMPLDSEGVNAARMHRNVAWIYMLAGKPEKAIDVLAPILAKTRNVSAASVRVDPRFAALHGNPRFEALLRR